MHIVSWQDNAKIVSLPWFTESDFSPAKKYILADDELKADTFYRMASEGSGFIWTGDFQNAKNLLQAVQRRIDDKKTKTTSNDFHKYRQTQSHRAQILSRLLICVDPDLTIPLRRAPDVHTALTEALETIPDGFVLSLRELLGMIGAHEWRKKGVFIPALDNTIHPHYGIFSPVRGEYLELIANARLPKNINMAFDIGTGTGVIAAILAKRGIQNIIVTDLDPRSIACATENISRLGFKKIKILKTDLFPEGKADLIVCNPPWLPARPTSRIERAVYDENNQMLLGFLKNVTSHLSENGEAWLVLSDLAEHLGLRKPNDLNIWIENAGLKIVDQIQTKPKHSKAMDSENPLHTARAKEITSLWILKTNP